MNLTIKDFVNYGSPCVICGDLMHFYFKEVIKDNNSIIYRNINCNFENQSLLVNLLITYHSKFQLNIDCKTNKFNIISYYFENSPKPKIKDINQFLESKIFKLELFCNKKACSSLCSSYLRFNFKKKFLYPIDINEEYLFIKYRTDIYYFSSNKSEDNRAVISVKGNQIELPPFNLIKLRNKDLILKRMKEYLLFS